MCSLIIAWKEHYQEVKESLFFTRAKRYGFAPDCYDFDGNSNIDMFLICSALDPLSPSYSVASESWSSYAWNSRTMHCFQVKWLIYVTLTWGHWCLDASIRKMLYSLGNFAFCLFYTFCVRQRSYSCHTNKNLLIQLFVTRFFFINSKMCIKNCDTIRAMKARFTMEMLPDIT